MKIFEVQDLVVQYDSAQGRALDGVSITVESGTMTVILGQNGSGKSTLLRCLAGLQHWKAGSIDFKGQSRAIDRVDFNRDIVFVAEDLMLPGYSLTVIADIYRNVWPKFEQALFERILAFGDVSPSARPNALSRGQRILVQFALALATHPEIILVDEVTATLDPYVRRLVVAELQAMRTRAGMTIVLATNIATEVSHIDCELILLRGGKVFEQGGLRDLAVRFKKIIVPLEFAPALDPHKFVQVAASPNGTVVFIAKADTLVREGIDAKPDQRAVAMEEMFVYLSDRRAQ